VASSSSLGSGFLLRPASRLPALVVPRSSPLFLGIDVGTSGVRLMLRDCDDALIASVREPLPPGHRRGAASEQDPEHWWRALVTACRRLPPAPRARIAALAIDGTSGTVLLTDAAGRPLHPALMYDDARAQEEAEALRAVAPADSPARGPATGLARLLWLAKQPFARHARHALHQADWLLGRLAGRFGDTDPNNALKTGYDPLARRWPAWLEKTDLPPEWLPRVHPAGTPLARIAPVMAAELGLPESTLLVAGTTDSTAAFLATGAREPGEAVTCLGSTLVLKVLCARPVAAPEYGIYSQPLGERWLAGGASNCGGAVLRRFFSDARLRELEPRLCPERSTGLQYTPLPGIGERFPVNDPTLAPVLEPRPDDDAVFLQGLLESLAEVEREGYRRLAACGAPWPASIRTTGGGAGNRAWTAIRAARLGVPLLPAEQTEAAWGAAGLAREGWLRKKEQGEQDA